VHCPRPIQYPVQAAGVTTRVVQWGLAGPAVLFVHGLGSHAGVWREVAPVIAAGGLRCFAVDAPGHGLSAKPAQFDYTLSGHSSWLAALLDALQEPQVDLVGSSLGGLWTAGFATQSPHRVRSLTLVGAVGLEPLAPERRQWTAQYLASMGREAIAQRLRASVSSPSVIDEASVEEVYRMNNSAGAAAAFGAIGRYYTHGINEDVQLDRLAEFGRGRPVLLVWGSDDMIVPHVVAERAAVRIPGSTLVSVVGARHIPHLERPAVVCWALAEHFAGRTVPAGARDDAQVYRAGAGL